MVILVFLDIINTFRIVNNRLERLINIWGTPTWRCVRHNSYTSGGPKVVYKGERLNISSVMYCLYTEENISSAVKIIYKDGDSTNTAFDNLSIQADNKISKPKSYCRRVCITLHGKKVSLGYFSSEEDCKKIKEIAKENIILYKNPSQFRKLVQYKAGILGIKKTYTKPKYIYSRKNKYYVSALHNHKAVHVGVTDTIQQAYNLQGSAYENLGLFVDPKQFRVLIKGQELTWV